MIAAFAMAIVHVTSSSLYDITKNKIHIADSFIIDKDRKDSIQYQIF